MPFSSEESPGPENEMLHSDLHLPFLQQSHILQNFKNLTTTTLLVKYSIAR